VIPYTYMLVAWIPISVLFMMDKNSARGFSLAMLLGLMILPARRDLVITGLPDIEKSNVAAIGCLIGTMIFHPNLLIKFRPRLSDIVLLVVTAMVIGTSVTNGFGAYDGLSAARNVTLKFLVPLFLARVHLSTPHGFTTFLYMFVLCAAAYAVPALWEFRMSPQLHRVLYGYFPHTWLMFARWGFYRPLVCFSHALPLARFFAVAAFLAMFALRKPLGKRFPYGQYIFLGPLAGLVASMSFGPYFMFLAMAGGYFIGRKQPWVIYAVPIAAAVWMALVLANARPLYGVTDLIASLDQQRADSLQYRLDALDEYSVPIREKPVFGHGGWGHGRTSRATDSAFLITSLARGLVSASLMYAWWLYAIHVCIRAAIGARGTPMADVLISIALIIAVGFATSMVDEGLDFQVGLMAAAAMGLELCLRKGVPGLAAAGAPAAGAAPGYAYSSR